MRHEAEFKLGKLSQEDLKQFKTKEIESQDEEEICSTWKEDKEIKEGRV